ncbi:MAG: hypothetical protein J6M20_06865 [Clostridia bacterium]|nr:hypothetical protein [Clostridia bacterium]
MSERTNSRISRKKAQRQLRMKRVLLTASLMVLVAVVSIGGTIAWLQDGTTTITNTFAPTGIDIELTETKNGPYKLIPGEEFDKNPIVTVVGSEKNVDIYLFVKFEEIAPGSKTTRNYLDYTSTLNTDNEWTQGDGNTIPKDVWYRTVSASTTDQEWHLLAGDKVTVLDSLTKENMPNANEVQLKYTAYAIQTAGFENAAAAWAVAKTYSAN